VSRNRELEKVDLVQSAKATVRIIPTYSS
jgi:hypothetical protein